VESLNSGLESNKEEEKGWFAPGVGYASHIRVGRTVRAGGSSIGGGSRTSTVSMTDTFKAHRLLYHSTLGLRVIKKKRRGGSHLDREDDRHARGDLRGVVDHLFRV